MRRRLVVIVVLLLASVWLAGKISTDPGYVMLAYGGTSIEMSLWVAIAGLMTIGLLVWLIKAVLMLFFRPIKSSTTWWRERSAKRSERRAKRGFIAYIEGHWSAAADLLERAANDTENPLGDILFAAKAAHHADNKTLCDDLLARAEALDDVDAVAVAAVKAQIMIDRDHWETAVNVLDRLRVEAMYHPVCLQLYAKIYSHNKQWTQLRDLLPVLNKRGQYTENELLQWRNAMSIGLLQEAADADSPLEKINKVWKNFPAIVRDDAEVLTCYANMLIKSGNENKAEIILKGFLRTDWDERVIDLYGRCNGNDGVRQLMLAESWLKQREKDEVLLLALGRLSLQNQLWAKAKEYFVASINAKPNAEAYAELSRLCGSLGEWQKSSQYAQHAVRLGDVMLPKLPQPTAMR